MTICAALDAHEMADARPFDAAALPATDRFIIALVGLAFEARIAAGPGVFVICRDQQTDVTGVIEAAVERGCRSIISFGVAGGLAPHLRAGDWIVASSVIDAGQTRPTDQALTDRMLALIPGATHAPIMGVDTAVTDMHGKRRIHTETGAAGVDMESHLVGRLAADHGLSFGAARVVIDPAHRAVPDAALAGMRPDGGTNVLAVMRGLIARPHQIGGLMRLAGDAYAAHRALRRTRRKLGHGFGLLDAAEA